jgi:1,4-alpha-glucan branching enzyme
MTSMNLSAFGPLRRPVAKKTLRAINFICQAPQAQSVSLVGDFNGWNSGAHPMKRMPDRAWFLTVELGHGHHRYAFLVDGVLTLDPQAQGIARNDQGERVSLVPVS